MHGDLGDTDEENLLQESPRKGPAMHFTKARVSLVAAGCFALVACVAIAKSSSTGSTPADASKPHTARSVLESDELAVAATDNVMTAGRMLVDESQRGLVLSKARQYFQDLTAVVQKKDPRGLAALEQVHMTDEQKGAMIRSLASMTDPRVQRLGLYVAQAVRKSPSDDPADIERSVKDVLTPHMEEIRRLQEEHRLEPLRELMSGVPQSNWHLDLDAGQIGVLKTFGDNWELRISAPSEERRRLQETTETDSLQAIKETESPLKKADKGFAIIKMISDQALVVLNIVKQCAAMFGKDLNVNTWITSAIGAADFVFGLVSCELDGAAESMDTVQMAICPLESSSAGVSAMRWMLGFAGILPDNKPENGHTGNHAGEPTT